MDGLHCKDGRRGLGGHDLRSGDTIVHRNTIAGDVTRATESFAIRPADGQSPMDAMLAGIEQWNHRHPDRWDTVATPGQYRMAWIRNHGRQLPMGWSASLAAAASAAGRLDPDLLRPASCRTRSSTSRAPARSSWRITGTTSWLLGIGTSKDCSRDELQTPAIRRPEHAGHHHQPQRGHERVLPAKTMSDGELLTQSRVYRDEYQHWREQDGGPVAQGMTGRDHAQRTAQTGTGAEAAAESERRSTPPDWDEFTDQAAISILQGQPISPTPALPQQEQPERDTEPTAVTQTPARTAAATKQVWPNAWVATGSRTPIYCMRRTDATGRR